MCFFQVSNCQHADRNELVRRSTLDLNIHSAHGQPARCAARPTNIDDVLKVIRWIYLWSRGRELAGGALRYPPKPEKKPNNCLLFDTEGEVLSSVLCTSAANCFYIIRLVSSRHT